MLYPTLTLTVPYLDWENMCSRHVQRDREREREREREEISKGENKIKFEGKKRN